MANFDEPPPLEEDGAAAGGLRVLDVAQRRRAPLEPGRATPPAQETGALHEEDRHLPSLERGLLLGRRRAAGAAPTAAGRKGLLEKADRYAPNFIHPAARRAR